MFTDEEYCLHNSVCFNIEIRGPVLNRESMILRRKQQELNLSLDKM